MNTALFITERFSEISTVALHIYFLYRTLESKLRRKNQVVAGAVFFCVRMVYFALGFEIRPYFALISGVVYAAFVFTGGFKTYTVWTIILVVLDGIVDAAIISLYLLLPDTVAEQTAEPGIVRIMFIIAAKATLFVVYHLITRKIDKNHALQWQDFIPLLIVPVGCWILLEVLFSYMDTVPYGMSDPLLAVGSIVLVPIMVSVVTLYNRITADGKELAQSKLQLHTAKMTQEHIHQINDLYAKMSTIRHDLQGHFAAISGYLSVKDYDSLEQYISSLTDFDFRKEEYTRHPVLNALISSKAAMAHNANISFSAQIEFPENLPISDVDLCILLSNILDNAFEANEKALEPRYIHLCAHTVNSYWVVACRNATHEQRRFRGIGSLKSTKDAAGAHGIGTKQIQRIAESSGGFVTYRHENYEFTTLAMIKLPK